MRCERRKATRARVTRGGEKDGNGLKCNEAYEEIVEGRREGVLKITQLINF